MLGKGADGPVRQLPAPPDVEAGKGGAVLGKGGDGPVRQLPAPPDGQATAHENLARMYHGCWACLACPLLRGGLEESSVSDSDSPKFGPCSWEPPSPPTRSVGWDDGNSFGPISLCGGTRRSPGRPSCGPNIAGAPTPKRVRCRG